MSKNEMILSLTVIALYLGVVVLAAVMEAREHQAHRSR